ncbi:MAG: hypothetical protein GX556_00205 [Fibrobacter sp.]|nr:hypothetical protein [Fibrobacter sp.]
MDRENENNLIKNAEHDPQAFGELFEEYHGGILRYCIYHTSQVLLYQLCRTQAVRVENKRKIQERTV